MGPENKRQDLSPKLSERLKDLETIIVSKIEEKVQSSTPAKKADPPWKDVCKLIGTLIILASWGTENYWVKPEESAKQQQLNDRLLYASNRLDIKVTLSAMRSAAYIKEKDSSKIAELIALKAGCEFLLACNNTMHAIIQFTPHTTVEEQKVYEEEALRFPTDQDIIQYIEDHKDFAAMQKMIKDYDSTIVSLGGQVQKYNQEWQDLAARIKSRRMFWAVNYVIGSLLLIAAVIPNNWLQRKTKPTSPSRI